MSTSTTTTSGYSQYTFVWRPGSAGLCSCPDASGRCETVKLRNRHRHPASNTDPINVSVTRIPAGGQHRYAKGRADA